MKRLICLLCLVLLLAASIATPIAASAQEMDDLDKAAEKVRIGLDRQDAAQAMEAMEGFLATAWKQLPFKAIEVTLAAGQPDDSGLFKPRDNNIYRTGEVLTIYLEVVGFTVSRDKLSGYYDYELSADFNLVDEKGQVLGGRRDIYHLKGPNRHFPFRLPLHFSYFISGLPAGSYRVETVLRDLKGGRSHTIITPIRIRND